MTDIDFDPRVCELRHDNVARELAAFKNEIIARFDRLDATIARHDGQGERIARLEETVADFKALRLWVVGAIGGALISVIVSIVMRVV